MRADSEKALIHQIKKRQLKIDFTFKIPLFMCCITNKHNLMWKLVLLISYIEQSGRIYGMPIKIDKSESIVCYCHVRNIMSRNTSTFLSRDSVATE